MEGSEFFAERAHRRRWSEGGLDHVGGRNESLGVVEGISIVVHRARWRRTRRLFEPQGTRAGGDLVFVSQLTLEASLAVDEDVIGAPLDRVAHNNAVNENNSAVPIRDVRVVA